MTRARRIALVFTAAVVAAAAAASAAFLLRTPSNDREWAADHARLPSVTFTGDTVRVRGVRDFRYGPDLEPLERWREESYALPSVRRVWFGLAPFADRYRGLAHTFLTFEFEGDRFLAVSVEARREAGEAYSLVGGLLRGFEVTYVVGTEEDLLGLRALRGDTLFLYPSVATPGQARALLRDMLTRAERLRERPEFYHTLFNNCNTNLRDHVNRATAAELPWGWGILLPGYSDDLALEEGLLDTGLEIEAARRRFRVDERARAALADRAGDFSRRIRGGG